jgi:SAM-dependent methyltransferase
VKPEPDKKIWDRYWERKKDAAPTYSNEGRIRKNLLPATTIEGKYILEVGAGTARDSAELSVEAESVFVLDYSPHSFPIVREVEKANGVSLHCVNADALLTPFPPSTFDIVFHQGLLEHFRDPLPLIRENMRILKPAGFLLIDVPQKWHPYTLFKHFLMWFGLWFAGWEREYTPGQLQQLLEGEGLRVISTYSSWMEPGLLYRVTRELLLHGGIELPLHPGRFPLFSDIKRMFRTVAAVIEMAPRFGFTLGMIAQKADGMNDRASVSS